MTPDEMNTLAGRVEAASGSDRELDADISLTLFGDRPYGVFTGQKHQVVGTAYLRDYVEAYRPVLTADDALRDDVVPRYTASLDAAMTLVPDGWGWLVSQPNEKAIASGLLKERTPVLGEAQYGCDLRFSVAAATPALALTAAAIRARANQGATDE